MRKYFIFILLLSFCLTAPQVWIGPIDQRARTFDVMYYVGRAQVEGLQFDVSGVKIDDIVPGTGICEQIGWLTGAGVNNRVLAMKMPDSEPYLVPIKGVLLRVHFTEVSDLKITLSNVRMTLDGYEEIKCRDAEKYLFRTDPTNEIPEPPRWWERWVSWLPLL